MDYVTVLGAFDFNPRSFSKRPADFRPAWVATVVAIEAHFRSGNSFASFMVPFA